jgi:hypothetical protein
MDIEGIQNFSEVFRTIHWSFFSNCGNIRDQLAVRSRAPTVPMV